jgi:uncharacterized protein YecT (DUF1311 family)
MEIKLGVRDRTREILDIRQRGSRTDSIRFDLETLQHHWSKHRDSKACVPDFYVIRLVTLLEVFARGNIASLIDHDKQYADRAIELSKHFKIDFALVRDIQGRAITLGDILAHSVPVNSFGQVENYFEILLGKALRQLLENVVDRWKELTKESTEPIIDDYDALVKCLSRVFEVRHILCHEAPRKPVYDFGEIDNFLDGAVRFTKALDEVLRFEKFGLVPLTQTEMNIAAGESLKNTELELDRLFSEISIRVGNSDEKNVSTNTTQTEISLLQCLKTSQENWLSYRKAHCEFETYRFRGGTIRSFLWATEAERITKLRIADLQSWLKFELERFS